MNAGVQVDDLKKRFPDAGDLCALEDLLARLQREELLAPDGEYLKLTSRGQLLADGIGSELLKSIDLDPGCAALEWFAG